MTEAQLFHCPTCGAPLDIQSEARTIRCPYCQNSVIVPEALRNQEFAQINDLGDIHLLLANNRKIQAIQLMRQRTNLGLKEAKDIVEAIERGESIDPVYFSQGLSVQTSTAMLDQGELLDLIQRGQKIEAIKRVRQATNLGLKEAKDAVEALERGDSMALPNAVINRSLAESAAEARPRTPVSVTTLDARTARKVAGAVGTAGAATGCGVVALIAAILAITLIPIIIALASDGGPLAPLWSKINPAAVATVDLTLKGEGIGPGQFTDPRTVAVDKDGNIYAADYSTGRVQSFDSQGTFRWLVNLGDEVYIESMDVSPAGVLFLAAKGDIRRFDLASGKELESLPNPEDAYFEDLAIAPDGRMAVIADGEDVLMFNPDLQPVFSVPAAVSSVTDDSELDCDVDMDAVGNIYVLGSFNSLVLKYSPQGKYINQFGGKTTQEAEGKFRAVGDIAVDGQGRVYVSDIFGVQVFDGDGRYLRHFKLFQFAMGMNFDLQNRLYVASNEPQVLRLVIKNDSLGAK